MKLESMCLGLIASLLSSQSFSQINIRVDGSNPNVKIEKVSVDSLSGAGGGSGQIVVNGIKPVSANAGASAGLRIVSPGTSSSSQGGRPSSASANSQIVVTAKKACVVNNKELKDGLAQANAKNSNVVFIQEEHGTLSSIYSEIVNEASKGKSKFCLAVELDSERLAIGYQSVSENSEALATAGGGQVDMSGLIKTIASVEANGVPVLTVDTAHAVTGDEAAAYAKSSLDQAIAYAADYAKAKGKPLLDRVTGQPIATSQAAQKSYYQQMYDKASEDLIRDPAKMDSRDKAMAENLNNALQSGKCDHILSIIGALHGEKEVPSRKPVNSYFANSVTINLTTKASRISECGQK